MDEFKPLGEDAAALNFSSVSIETVENYWDRRPCNLFHSAAELGTCQYFDEVERRKYFVEPHIPAFADFQAWRGKRLASSSSQNKFRVHET